MSITSSEIRDPQQKIVYSWEAAHVESQDSHILSYNEIRELVRHASGLIGIMHPDLKFKKTNAHCRAYPIKNLIVITNWGKTKTTVLHELAHIADFQITKGKSGMGHGPIFLGISMALYSFYLKIPISYLHKSALGMGLKFINLSLETKSPDFFDDDF